MADGAGAHALGEAADDGEEEGEEGEEEEEEGKVEGDGEAEAEEAEGGADGGVALQRPCACPALALRQPPAGWPSPGLTSCWKDLMSRRSPVRVTHGATSHASLLGARLTSP